jgi:hypothetical protein
MKYILKYMSLMVILVCATTMRAHIFIVKNHTNKKVPIRIQLEGAWEPFYDAEVPAMDANSTPGTHEFRFVAFEGGIADLDKSRKFGFCLERIQMKDAAGKWDENTPLKWIKPNRYSEIMAQIAKKEKPDLAQGGVTKHHFCFSCTFDIIEAKSGVMLIIKMPQN